MALLVAAVCAVTIDAAQPATSAGAESARAAKLNRADRARCAQKPTRRKRRACRRRARARQRQPQPQPAPEPARLFAPSSFWNVRLANDAPLDAKSAVYVARLQELLRRWSPYINTTRYSTPVYTVSADQPPVRVSLDRGGSNGLQEAFDQVPIPSKARPAAGSDGHMVVWQPSTDTMWEFWVARRLSDGWHARYGGRIQNVSQSPGHYTAIRDASGGYVEHPLWGASATSLPLLGGLIRIDEMKAGRIDHALAIALPEIRAGAYSWPAQRTDGKSDRADAIPEGARLRIDPRVDLDQLQMAPSVRTLAEAAQRYGIVVRDGAGAVTFFAEDPSPTGSNPFIGVDGLFGVRYIDQALRDFPWDRLQVLATDMTYPPQKGILGRSAE
jgi:hypothetical protein